MDTPRPLIPGTSTLAQPLGGFDPEKLKLQFDVVKWQRRINIRESKLLTHRKEITEYLNPVEAQTFEKLDKLFRKSSSVSRTMHDQAMACLEIVCKRMPTEEDPRFPQEKRNKLMDILAEAQQLSELMGKEAEKLRQELQEGNLKYVDQLA